MIKIAYIDEEAGWQSIAYSALSDKYEMLIPEGMPQNISEIWAEVQETQIAIIDYRLNGNGLVAYTGDDVAREIHKHNKHFPVIIITSFEDNAIQESTEVQVIRGKDMLTSPEMIQRLSYMIDSAVSSYDRRKKESEECILRCQEKVATGTLLTRDEESDRFNAELYISELDLDSSLRQNLIFSPGTLKSLEEMLTLARQIVNDSQK